MWKLGAYLFLAVSAYANTPSFKDMIQEITTIMHDPHYASKTEALKAAFPIIESIPPSEINSFYEIIQKNSDELTRLFAVMSVQARQDSIEIHAILNQYTKDDIHFEHQSVKPAIERARNDPSPLVRKYAYRLYKNLPSVESVNELKVGLFDPDPAVRDMAAEVLKQDMTSNPEAAQAVHRLAVDLLRTHKSSLHNIGLQLLNTTKAQPSLSDRLQTAIQQALQGTQASPFKNLTLIHEGLNSTSPVIQHFGYSLYAFTVASSSKELMDDLAHRLGPDGTPTPALYRDLRKKVGQMIAELPAHERPDRGHNACMNKSLVDFLGE